MPTLQIKLSEHEERLLIDTANRINATKEEAIRKAIVRLEFATRGMESSLGETHHSDSHTHDGGRIGS